MVFSRSSVMPPGSHMLALYADWPVHKAFGVWLLFTEFCAGEYVCEANVVKSVEPM